ncbi:MAG: DUF86 domain-containing protein [Verrucomicrobiota bacterium]|nr:DUF86 domain-containing protein [Verrucomicrobiota bacterium]
MHIEPDDILFNKATIIERCIKRIDEEYAANRTLKDYTHLDAMTLNIERACQAAIDMATHILAIKHLGIPQSSSDAFVLLYKNTVITNELLHSLKAMVGFRNVAIHQYQILDIDILRYIAEEGSNDFIKFCANLGIKIKR